MGSENKVSNNAKLIISAYKAPSEKTPFGEKEVLFKGLANTCLKDEFLNIAGKWFDELGNMSNSGDLIISLHYKPT